MTHLEFAESLQALIARFGLPPVSIETLLRKAESASWRCDVYQLIFDLQVARVRHR